MKTTRQLFDEVTNAVASRLSAQTDFDRSKATLQVAIADHDEKWRALRDRLVSEEQNKAATAAEEQAHKEKLRERVTRT